MRQFRVNECVGRKFGLGLAAAVGLIIMVSGPALLIIAPLEHLVKCPDGFGCFYQQYCPSVAFLHPEKTALTCLITDDARCVLSSGSESCAITANEHGIATLLPQADSRCAALVTPGCYTQFVPDTQFQRFDDVATVASFWLVLTIVGACITAFDIIVAICVCSKSRGNRRALPLVYRQMTTVQASAPPFEEKAPVSLQIIAAEGYGSCQAIAAPKLPILNARNIAYVEQTDDETQQCVACLENRKTIAIDPCGHIVLCPKCQQEYRSQVCPLCNTLIKQFFITIP